MTNGAHCADEHRPTLQFRTPPCYLFGGTLTLPADRPDFICDDNIPMNTAFLSDDVCNFFLAALDADLSTCNGHLLTAAQSDSPTRFIDLEPGLSILGWKPIKWPQFESSEA